MRTCCESEEQKQSVTGIKRHVDTQSDTETSSQLQPCHSFHICESAVVNNVIRWWACGHPHACQFLWQGRLTKLRLTNCGYRCVTGRPTFSGVCIFPCLCLELSIIFAFVFFLLFFVMCSQTTHSSDSEAFWQELPGMWGFPTVVNAMAHCRNKAGVSL